MCDLPGQYAADVTVQDDPHGAHHLLSGTAGKFGIPGESPKISHRSYLGTGVFRILDQLD